MREKKEKEQDLFRLGFGCLRLPTTVVEGKEIIDRDEVEKMVTLALEHGVNFFDCVRRTEEAQGERIMGELLRPYRDQVYIGIRIKIEDAAQAANMETQLRQHLDNLGTDYVDYLYLQVENSMLFASKHIRASVLEQLNKMKEDGLVDHIAFPIGEMEVSSLDKLEFVEKIHFPADTMLTFYNPLRREMEGAIRKAKERGYRNIVACPLEMREHLDRKLICQFAWGNAYVDMFIAACTSVDMMWEVLELEAHQGRRVLSAIERDLYSRISGERKAEQLAKDKK